MSQRQRGRPRKNDALLQPVTIRLSEPIMRKIKAMQSARMDQPDQSQVIRELLATALAAATQREDVAPSHK